MTEHPTLPLIGSMSRRGNPFDNARAENLIKTLKVEAVSLADYETLENVSAGLTLSTQRGALQEVCSFRSPLTDPRQGMRVIDNAAWMPSDRRVPTRALSPIKS